MARIAVLLVGALVSIAMLAGALAGCDRDGSDRPEARTIPTPESSAMATELPVPRTEVAGATWRGQLVVAGGLTADGGASGLVHVYDAAADAWRPGPRLPVPLHHAGMAVLAERLYVVGGYTNEPGRPWRAQSAVVSLGAGEERWREEPPLALGPRGALGLAAAGGNLVAAGGEAGGRASTPPSSTTRPGAPGGRGRRWPGPGSTWPRRRQVTGSSPSPGARPTRGTSPSSSRWTRCTTGRGGPNPIWARPGAASAPTP